MSYGRANQLLSHPKQVFGSLTFCHRNDTHLSHKQKKTPKYVHDFICCVK